MPIIPGSHTADHPEPLVVFVSGMRINPFHKSDKWCSVLCAMPSMLHERTADLESGFLGAEFLPGGIRTITVLQYRTDFERLEAYCRARDKRPWPA